MGFSASAELLVYRWLCSRQELSLLSVGTLRLELVKTYICMLSEFRLPVLPPPLYLTAAKTRMVHHSGMAY